MADSNDFEALFELAQHELKYVIDEFAAYGVQVKPGLEVRQAKIPAFYYDRQSGQIYIFIPESNSFAGMLYVLFLGSLFGCNSNQELIEIYRLWIPYLIAHEVAHSLRDYYGLLGTDEWAEEQIAIQLATALTQRRLSPTERAQAVERLSGVIQELKRRMGNTTIGPEAFYDILDALGIEGKLGRWDVDELHVIQQALSISPEEMLKSSGELPEDLLQRRDEVITAFNNEYASNLNQYAYYQLSCLYYELVSRETNYIDEFIRLHLGKQIDLLPTVSSQGVPPTDAEITACFQASRLTTPLSQTANRYFYKRYRSLLLERLNALTNTTANIRTQEAVRVLETWEETNTDMLRLVEQIVPPSIRGLLPHRIEATVGDQDVQIVEVNLPCETDQRLWRHVYHHALDESAAATLQRLEALDQATILRGLPAEVLLELGQMLAQIKLKQGETLIWEGDAGNDMYILSSGELYVVQGNKHIHTVKPSEVVGEMAFLARTSRTATVQAAIPSECFVLKAYDFHLIGLRHPSILMQMSRLLAHQLLDLRALTAGKPE